VVQTSAIFSNSYRSKYQAESLEAQLTGFTFNPCLPSLPSSCGWVPPIEIENAPLIHYANGYLLFCLQIEDKVLPAAVVRQSLDEKIKHLETTYDRKNLEKREA